MVARTGLFVAPLPGSTPAGTSPTDGRLVLGALYGTTAGCLSGGSLTASATVMQVTVAAAVWRIPDPTNAAGVYLAPADSAVLTFSAGPASGSRIDVLWVRQNNYEAGDADSRVTYGVAVGTAATTPVPPAIPAGAMKIGQLTVPTGVANAAACVLVPSFTSVSGTGPIASALAYATGPQAFPSANAPASILTQNVVGSDLAGMAPTSANWGLWRCPFIGRYRFSFFYTMDNSSASNYQELIILKGTAGTTYVGNDSTRKNQPANEPGQLSSVFFNDTAGQQYQPQYDQSSGATSTTKNSAAWSVNDHKAARVLLEYLG